MKKKYFVVFRSRSQVLDFIYRMHIHNHEAKAISTPKDLGLGCGISAEILGTEVGNAYQIVNYYNFDAFWGIYSLEKNGNRNTLIKIY